MTTNTKLLLFHRSEETGNGLWLGFDFFQTAVGVQLKYRLLFLRSAKLLIYRGWLWEWLL